MININKIRILIAEDDPVSLLMVHTIIDLILPECKILEAINGLQAVEFCRVFQPNLVFLDIQMPEMDGFEATRKIRQVNKQTEIPIIALTGESTAGEREKCLEAGMNDFITKPVQKEIIAWIMDKYLFKLETDTKPDLTEKTKVDNAISNNEVDNSLAHFDRNDMLARLDNDEELLNEILIGIKDYLPIFPERIKSAHNEKNYPALSKLGHELKGAAMTGSFNHLAKLALNLEKFDFSNYENNSTLNGLLGNIYDEINYIIKSLL